MTCYLLEGAKLQPLFEKRSKPAESSYSSGASCCFCTTLVLLVLVASSEQVAMLRFVDGSTDGALPSARSFYLHHTRITFRSPWLGCTLPDTTRVFTILGAAHAAPSIMASADRKEYMLVCRPHRTTSTISSRRVVFLLCLCFLILTEPSHLID